ncbi:serine/arginine repetitive matrix protein 2-like, partial [Octopus sinensis]|uniref:Serine/arginine repetitive matrix protein 2-like n=1 Tax=Octopus sinensis TaxID=2607531 RepID=A0A6P7TWW3_9MOLL
MTVKEARMEKRVKWMSSANALPSRSQRRRRALAKGDYDDYDGMDDDDANFEDSGSIRALSVSTPDLHRDDDDFIQIENMARSPMRSTTKEIRRPEKLHKIIKSTSPSRGKESKSGRSSGSKTEGGYSNQKGDPVRYIRVGRDIKHTEKKVPSSPLTSRHAKRSPSGSRSPTTKARGLSKDRHRQSRSKSPKRADSRTRTPQVVRSLSASNEMLKTKKLKDRRTKSMEKTSRRARDQEPARTGKPSPLSPRAAAKRSESRRAHRDREYQDSDDSDINEPHTLFMELSKTVSPYSSSSAHQEPQNELALNKYNLLKRSSSNLLQLVKDSEMEALPMADAGKMQSLSVAKDSHQRSVSPRGRPSHSGKEEARHHRSQHSESREKSSGGGGRSMEPRSSSRRANNSEEPLSPTIPDGSVFYDDDNVSPVSPTFPSSSSQKYTRTFSPPRHTLRDWKRTGSRADDDDDDVCIDIETSDLESDPTAGKPYISEKSPLRSPR